MSQMQTEETKAIELGTAQRRVKNLWERCIINDRHYGADARPDLHLLLAEARATVLRLTEELNHNN